MKKKILIIAMSFIVLAMTVASVTTAYFTDTDKATNTFTVGDVKIKLTETHNGNTVTIDGADQTFDYGKVYPNQSYEKNPTITNTGSEDAFVAAKITLKNVNGAGDTANIASVLTDEATVAAFLDGIVTTGYKVTYEINADNVVVRIIYLEKTSTNGSIKLFSNVKVPAEWGNTEMANLKNLNIVVEGYATQVVGFEATAEKTAAEVAIAAAFPEF